MKPKKFKLPPLPWEPGHKSWQESLSNDGKHLNGAMPLHKVLYHLTMGMRLPPVNTPERTRARWRLTEECSDLLDLPVRDITVGDVARWAGTVSHSERRDLEDAASFWQLCVDRGLTSFGVAEFKAACATCGGSQASRV